MKRLIPIILLCVMITGCSMTRPRIVHSSFLNFQPYTQEGFYISQNPYPENCQILGEILLDIDPAIVKERHEKFKNQSWYAYERIEGDELLELAVKKAREAGGDGLVNLRIEQKWHGDKDNISHFDGYLVSGTVIVRPLAQ